MNVYYLQHPSSVTDDVVDIPDKQNRISGYFIWNSNDGKFLKFMRSEGIAQDLLSEVEIEKFDYLKW